MSALLKPRTGGLLALAAVIALLPLGLQNSFHYDVAILIGLNAVVCVGLNLLIGYAGQISLGHAGFFALGGYFSAILTDRYDVDPLGAMIVGAIAVGLLSALIARPILTDRYDVDPLGAMIVGAIAVGLLSALIARPILKLKGHYLAMATLGLGIIISIVLNQEGDLTGGPDGMPVGAFTLFGWEPSGNLHWYWITGGFLLFTVWLALNLVDSPVGRALRAVHGSELAAGTMGVDTLRYKVLVFTVSAVLASLAGSIFAHYTGFLTPSESEFFRSIEFVTMVVLGGLASIYGAVVGAAILTVLPQLLAAFHDYEMIVLGAVLMGIMIFMRRGLVPSITQFIQARYK